MSPSGNLDISLIFYNHSTIFLEPRSVELELTKLTKVRRISLHSRQRSAVSLRVALVLFDIITALDYDWL